MFSQLLRCFALLVGLLTLLVGYIFFSGAIKPAEQNKQRKAPRPAHNYKDAFISFANGSRHLLFTCAILALSVIFKYAQEALM